MINIYLWVCVMRGAKPTKFLNLGDLKVNESVMIAGVTRATVRDAIRRYKDRSYMTRQIENEVLVVRIK